MAKVRNLSDIQQEIAFTEFDFYQRKPPVKYVFSAISSSSIFVPKNKTYDDTRRSCRNYYVLQGTQSNL